MDDLYFTGNRNTLSRLTELDARLVRRDEILQALQSGQKIRAIKLYREDTGASLADAKAAVERMEFDSTGVSYPSEPQQWAGVPQESVSEGGASQGGTNAEVEFFVMQGRKIEAIKLYRQQTGLGLREAKEAVDRIDQSLRSSVPSPMFEAQPTGIGQSGESPNEEVRRYLLAGKKINAIKAYRQQTGLSLKDAKDEIERFERALRSGLI